MAMRTNLVAPLSIAARSLASAWAWICWRCSACQRLRMAGSMPIASITSLLRRWLTSAWCDCMENFCASSRRGLEMRSFATASTSSTIAPASANQPSSGDIMKITTR